MTIRYQGTSNSANFNDTASYSVVSKSTSGAVTTYKVNVTSTGQSSTQTSAQSTTATAWVQSNGNVIAVSFAGQNVTGSTATTFFNGLMVAFGAELSANGQITAFTNPLSFHTVNTTSVTQPTSMSVTTYAANSLPETIVACTGTTTIQSFTWTQGIVPGTKFTLVTVEGIQGSSTGSSGSVSFSFSLRVLSLTKA